MAHVKPKGREASDAPAQISPKEKGKASWGRCGAEGGGDSKPARLADELSKKLRDPETARPKVVRLRIEKRTGVRRVRKYPPMQSGRLSKGQKSQRPP